MTRRNVTICPWMASERMSSRDRVDDEGLEAKVTDKECSLQTCAWSTMIARKDPSG